MAELDKVTLALASVFLKRGGVTGQRLCTFAALAGGKGVTCTSAEIWPQKALNVCVEVARSLVRLDCGFQSTS